MSWKERLSQEHLDHWEVLEEAASAALPNSGLPDGVGLEEAVTALLLVAEAKGLVRVSGKDEPAPRLQVTPRGAPVAPLVVPLAMGEVIGWPAAVRAVSAAEAEADPDAYFDSLDEAAREAPEEERPSVPVALLAELWQRLRPLVQGGKLGACHVVVARRESGEVLGLAWLPAGESLPSDLEPGGVAMLSFGDGRTGMWVPRPLVQMAASYAAVELHLVRSLAAEGGMHMLMPVSGEEDLYESLGALEGQPDETAVQAFLRALDRLTLLPPALEQPS